MKTAIVTGACTNTGVDIVNKFLEEGYKVFFTGRDALRVAEAEKNYKERYTNADITGYAIDSNTPSGEVDEESVNEFFSFIDKSGAKIDTVVLNAAHQGLNMKIFENPLIDFIKVINTNVIWNYCICEHAAKRMKENGSGNIVFINSNTAYRAIPNRIAYSTSKGAQLGMMRAMALDLGKYNIRVNAILPGMIKTDRWVKNPDFYKDVPSKYTPIGDVANGNDIADAVWYFVAHARNTTGAELVVDGGNTIQLYPIIPKE